MDGIPDGPGWRGAVHELVFRLEVFGGFWSEYAYALNRLLPRDPRPEEVPDCRELLVNEQQLLVSAIQVLAAIENRSWANLSQAQQGVLKSHLRQAIKAVQERQRSIPNELESDDAALKAVERFMGRLRTKKVKRDPRDRDSCIYHWRKNGKSLKWIKDSVNRNPNWEPLHAVESISAAAKRFAKKHGLPWPIKRS